MLATVSQHQQQKQPAVLMFTYQANFKVTYAAAGAHLPFIDTLDPVTGVWSTTVTVRYIRHGHVVVYKFLIED